MFYSYYYFVKYLTSIKCDCCILFTEFSYKLKFLLIKFKHFCKLYTFRLASRCDDSGSDVIADVSVQQRLHPVHLRRVGEVQAGCEEQRTHAGRKV